MAPNLTYVVDDQDSAIEYLCQVTQQTVLGSFFNNTWTTIASPDCGAGWFKYTFNGTAVRLVASSSHVNQNFSVQIDNSPLLVQTGQGVYESPTLPDGQHSIVYAIGDESVFPAFDFLTVTAGTSTSLSNRTLIVDDDDSSINYSGNWTVAPPASVIFDYSASPYLNTTHWTNSVGDTFSFKFKGSSISVFGVLPNLTADGNVTTSYTLDGKSTLLSLPDSTGMVSPMTRFFHADLDSGDHTLLVNITSVTTSQPIGFDFVLYNSSADSTTIPSASSAIDHSSSKVGVMVGAVLGAVFGLFLVLALVIFMWRRKSKAKTQGIQRVYSKEQEKFAQEAYTPPVLLKDGEPVMLA